MSWSGFKKNVGRATTQVMMKTGHVEKTSDREYEVEERRYRTLESASLRLQKEAKGYLDSLRAMTASQMRIAETIDAFYGDSGASDGVSRSYKQAVEDLDAETVKALDGPYRCVTQDPHISDLVLFDEELGIYDHEVLAGIEAELNFNAGNKRNYTTGLSGGDLEGAQVLIESIYRTTVLEPINRFCAYFPDINECIKKRNHKMLDYDAMRSKVKKLVEKPDKDPSKLPRTEKETEMVMDASTFLRSDHLFDSLPNSPKKEDLIFLSPPKALDGLKQNDKMAKLQADEDAAMRSVGLKRKSSMMGKVSRLGNVVRNSWTAISLTQEASSENSDELHLLKPPSPAVRSSWASSRSGDLMSMLREASSEDLGSPTSTSPPTATKAAQLSPSPSPRHASVPLPTVRVRDLGSSPTPHQKETGICDSASLKRHSGIGSTVTTPSRRTKSVAADSTSTRPRLTPAPFFIPSELEEIMRPFKEKFIQEQADGLAQAKVAYEQLNQQLTDELPQLIDLRVPYLDPSFEALVKIQLRFCAEAYSRMAQVQQYLDASTRDQYASGDLDARVEDVLGQIRELSIAGTV
ncbi:hypothetical protein AC579_8453 [Pseudocercospora musae]|uniref:BAR domain-containing protein n=1 Tax=Pseudocercospora musae TaxID=113226 RepID=A0A139I0Q3_9PEZI|nr:hypothetical protein AC579_8453 [Pseudocercospora musae]